MWNYCVERWGYHHRKKMKKRGKSYTKKLHQKFFSMLLAALSVLLISCVRVASLLAPPRVDLWQCRTQHLRQYSSRWKIKQRGHPVISCHIWYLPLLLMGWQLTMISIILHALKYGTTYKMDEGKTQWLSVMDC